MRQAIDDDRSKNRVTKGSKTTTSINKAKREANSAERDGGRGRVRGRGRGRDGRGRGRNGRGGRGASSTRVPYEIWKDLSKEAQAIILATQQRKTPAEQRTMYATQLTYGPVQLPAAVWSQLPPGAQEAITAHNTTVTSGRSTQANTHMQTQPTQGYGTLLPTGTQTQQVNAHQQSNPSLLQGTSSSQNPAQPFLHTMMSTPGVPVTETHKVLFHNGKTYYQASMHKTRYKCITQEIKGT